MGTTDLRALRRGDELPEELDALCIEWAAWDEQRVPKALQDYVRNYDSATAVLWLGLHPEHGYFFVEVYDKGNSPDYFHAWWNDIETEQLTVWAASQTDKELARVFLVNGLLLVISRAAVETKYAEASKFAVFERVHKAVVEEGKRRGLKMKGGLS